MTYKVLETEGFIFFLTGPGSNWHTGYFEANFKPFRFLPNPGQKYTFCCGEQYMMAGKALLFEDVEIFDKIMSVTQPREHKELGRLVHNFKPEVWDSTAEELVFRGSCFRAVQCKDYRDMLLTAKDKQFVEGNKDDRIWGVGLHWDDPAILDPANWRGKNLLGKVHNRVQKYIIEQIDFGWSAK